MGKRGAQAGERNPFWKGGRTIASNGYMLVKLLPGHHLSDVRGYAYEHRVVAEQKMGRRLLPGEQVHHIDGNKLNNRPDNLEVVADTAHHRLPAPAAAVRRSRSMTSPGVLVGTSAATTSIRGTRHEHGNVNRMV